MSLDERIAIERPTTVAMPWKTAPGRSERTPRAPRPGLVLAVASGAQFMFILDLSIATLALPSIRSDLNLSTSQLQWILVSYGLTLGGFLLLGGRTADLVGRRKVLIAGLGLFAAASLTAGIAQSFATLVASRGVQGLAAAFATPAALSIVTSTFPEGPQRNRALGIFGAVGAAAATAGLVLGGAITTTAGWPWVFLMNVPIGAALIVAAAKRIPRSVPDGQGSADIPGAVLVTGGLMAIVFAVSESSHRGWLSSTTIGFTVGGVAVLAGFSVVERRADSPILPVRIFRNATLTSAIVIATLLFAAFFGFNVPLTLLMQQLLEYSPLEAGVAWLATSVAAIAIAMAVAPRVVNRVGAGGTLVVGQVVGVAGLLWFARLPLDPEYLPDLFPGLVLLGVDVGFSAMAVQVAAFKGIDKSVAGVAGGVIESFREIGGALGTAIIATVLVGGSGHDHTGEVDTDAFVSGLHRSALVAAGFSFSAAVVAGTVLRRAERRTR